MKLFFISVLLVSLSFSDTNLQYLQNKALNLKIDQSPTWKKLLHINKNETISEIKDKTFFISNKIDNPKEELLKTIEYFYTNKFLESKESSICKFGARYKFLDKKLGLAKYIEKQECKERSEFLKKLDATSLSIVFSSAYLNSPSSQAGHTFLKVNNSKSDVSSYSINYGAHTQNENIISYVYKGLFGGYDGTFDIIRYSKKIEEYSGGEQRDLYQYRLDFNEKELDFILLHLYEIHNIPKPYMFVNKNCSYQILWLIQLPKKDLYLTNHFSFEVAPIETLKLLDKNKLIKLEAFRYSLEDKIEFIYNNILTSMEKEILASENFIEDFKKNTTKIENKASLIDVKVMMIRYDYLKLNIKRKEYIQYYIPLLRLRASLDEKPLEVKIKKDKILETHAIKSIRLGFNRDDNKDGFLVSYKSAYHNIIDYETSLDSGYIDYFGFDYIFNENDSYLKKFNILDIRSYAKSTELFPKLSWSLSVNYEDMFIESDEKYFNLKLGIGKSYQYEDMLKVFFMISPFVAINENEESGYQYETGIIYINEYMKLGLEFDRRKEKNYYNLYNGFLTIPINENNSISITYERENKISNINVLYNYYF